MYVGFIFGIVYEDLVCFVGFGDRGEKVGLFIVSF